MKRLLLSILLSVACLRTADAQVILLDTDEGRNRVETTEEVPFIPWLGVTYDQYAPLSDGMLLMCCLGGAYLLKKKRKTDK